jgi:transposase
MGKKIYSVELKMEVVTAVLNSDKSIDTVAKDYAINKTTINKWVTSYKQTGIEGVEREYRSYTPEFKMQVVKDLRANNLSYRSAATKYNIGIHTTIKQWERIYLEEGYEGLKKHIKGVSSQTNGYLKGRKPVFRKEINEDLIAENQRLKMENEYLKKLNALVRSKEN